MARVGVASDRRRKERRWRSSCKGCRPTNGRCWRRPSPGGMQEPRPSSKRPGLTLTYLPYLPGYGLQRRRDTIHKSGPVDPTAPAESNGHQVQVPASVTAGVRLTGRAMATPGSTAPPPITSAAQRDSWQPCLAPGRGVVLWSLDAARVLRDLGDLDMGERVACIHQVRLDVGLSVPTQVLTATAQSGQRRRVVGERPDQGEDGAGRVPAPEQVQDVRAAVAEQVGGDLRAVPVRRSAAAHSAGARRGPRPRSLRGNRGAICASSPKSLYVGNSPYQKRSRMNLGRYPDCTSNGSFPS